ncbi:MAG: hypothetical protein IT167_10490 [Bryobacterales bacterium]|nr:hypothetical protein [Bryobacterales bacterium]
MRSIPTLAACASTTALLAATLCLYAQNQAPETPASAREIQGIPPRAAPSDYQSKGKAGNVTVAAEFLGHSIPTSQGTLTTEDYVVVEAALFGPPESHATLSPGDFSLRINRKKTPLTGEPYAVVFKSLKDPEWGPTAAEKAKSKTSVGGGGGAGDPPPTPPKMPFNLRRAMEQRVQKVAMAEGDRPLPQAGLLFFPYRGKEDHIQSVELDYNGAAGKATLALQ